MAKQLEARPHTGQVETEWTQIEVVMNKVAGKVLGYSERKVNNRWFDEHCKKALDHRKNTRLKTMEDGNEEIKICKRAKITHLEKELKELEESWKSKELRNFYREIKRGKGQHRKPSHYLKDKGGHLIGDKEGHLIGDKEGQLNRFAENFEELLNQEEGEMKESRHDSKEEQEDAEVETTLMVPTKKEMEEQIESLKSNKATGENNISAEMLKQVGEAMIARIWKLVAQVWEKEKIPEGWNKALIIGLNKFGKKKKYLKVGIKH
ncbi:hypothetical protein QE152_g9862 [Popillia japonica]|uniref:Uncharacterized protein n=1 Tax=Popillia japonica TaxID=7064 RepID=A0AAW1LXD2_POPJA